MNRIIEDDLALDPDNLDYKHYTITGLQKILRGRNLSITGSKDVLIERLFDDDLEKNGTNHDDPPKERSSGRNPVKRTT